MHQLARVLMALALIATITTANNASDAPVAWWRFDEGKGDTVHDASGRGHDGKVVGARWVDGKFGKALYFDGNARVVIPDAKNLRLRGPISVEAWIKPDDISTWRMIVRKELEYQLRISPPQEGNNTAFFVFLSGRWEHRVNNAIPEVGKWHHIVGVWTGERLVLWFNGEPMSIWRRGTPKWTSNPVLIGSGFVGAIDDVRIYQRPLTWDEVLAHYRGEEVSVMRRTQLTKFTFAKGIQGWRAMKCLTRLEVRNGQLAMTTLASDPLLSSPPLEIDTKVSEFMSIRMSVDGGRTGAVLFSTDAGFERIPFELRPDGRMHTYNIDLAASTQWEGKLMRIGIVPSDAPNVHVRIESIAFVEQPSGAPDVVVERCHLERPINRAGRPAKLIAVVRNFGGVAKNVRIALDLPNGIELLRGKRIQGCNALKFDDEFTAEWLVRA
ncbi:MAG TPA: LamG domain-containing protein, partial [Armatimonadetes bacterium]|nr:LamG domain-containing protein [Armatimonadota bacterium]